MAGSGDTRVLPFLRVRRQTDCGLSGRELQEGDPLIRTVKCLHWFLASEIRRVVVKCIGEVERVDLEEEGPWTISSTSARPLPLKCPTCERSIAVEIND